MGSTTIEGIGVVFEKVTIGSCDLYLGDAMDILPLIGRIDATVTDPPYGVMLGEIKNGQSISKGQTPYTKFSDTPDYVRNSVIPIIEKCREISDRVVITPGNRNMWDYPRPDDLGVWYNPAGTSRGKWGFNLVVTPIMYYGKDPRAGKGSYASSTWGKCDSVSDIKNILHPCPKPILFTKWLIWKATLEGEIVLDPFMGSGTTGVCCANMGRSFVGIEIEEKYFEAACKRIEKAQEQSDMFAAPMAAPTQEAMQLV